MKQSTLLPDEPSFICRRMTNCDNINSLIGYLVNNDVIGGDNQLPCSFHFTVLPDNGKSRKRSTATSKDVSRSIAASGLSSAI